MLALLLFYVLSGSRSTGKGIGVLGGLNITDENRSLMLAIRSDDTRNILWERSGGSVCVYVLTVVLRSVGSLGAHTCILKLFFLSS